MNKTNREAGGAGVGLALFLRRSRTDGLFDTPAKSGFTSRRNNYIRTSGVMRTVGSLAVLMVSVLVAAIVAPIQSERHSAEAVVGTAKVSTLTFDSSNATASVNLNITSADGTFATSTDGTNNTVDQRVKFSISTNNATGYTVKLTATGATTTLSDGGSGVSEHTIASIESATSLTDFTDTGSTGQALNNKWGYIPNYYNSVANTTTYYPAPTNESEDTLRVTSSANAADGISNADEYTIGLGLRADYTNPSGTYANDTFIIQYVANQIAYEINFVDGSAARKSTDLPSSMTSSTYDTSVTLPDTIPTKDGYDFAGWCTVEPAATYGTNSCVDSSDNAGLVFAAGSEFGIDQTIDYSNISLYALWTSKCNTSATTIGTGSSTDAVCMQDINDTVINSMPVGTQYQLRDSRDWKQYYVARQADGKVWMTQNLDLDIETAPNNVEPLTSVNTDLGSAGSGAYATGYTTTGGVRTWTPARATSTSASAWSNNLNSPYSYDYGSKYIYTNTSGATTSYNSLAACEAVYNDGTCNHYHTGNYYNFTAAVASSSTSGITTGDMANSICPAGWRLSSSSTRDDAYLWFMSGITTSYGVSADKYSTYKTYGENEPSAYTRLSTAPLYTVRSGSKVSTSAPSGTTVGYYWMRTISDANYSWLYYFNGNYAYPYTRYGGNWIQRSYGLSVRCIARQGNTGKTTITFDKNNNSAEGTMSAQDVNANTTANLNSNTFTLTDYYFNGWNTASDGSGIAYTNGGGYYSAAGTDNKSVTLYAQWVPAHTLTIVADTDIKVSGDNGTTWTNAGGTTTIIVGEGNTVILKAKDDTMGTVFSNWTLDTTAEGAGSFTNTAWRKTTTKTTTFVVGTTDAAVTAHGTTAYKTIADSTNESPLTMQEITACPDWLATGTSYQVTDPRKNNNDESQTVQTYYVAKLADGKCWMLDNLRLGGTSSVALTSTDSNVRSAGYTLPGNKTSWSNTYTSGEVNTTYKDTVASTAYGSASKKIGVYYNYCAASAGTVCTSSDTTDASYDICPKGWRMPTGGGVNTTKGYGEYQALYTAMSSNQSNYKSALSLPLSGFYYSSSAHVQGSYGYFWSSSFLGGTRSFSLNANSSGVLPTNLNDRYNGFSVRCVFGG